MKNILRNLPSIWNKIASLAVFQPKKFNLITVLAALGIVGLVSSMGAAQALGYKPSVPASARYIVKFKTPQSNKGLAVLEASAPTHSVSVKPEILINPQLGAYTFTAPQKSQLDAYLKALQSHPQVEYIEVDGIMKTQ